MGVGKDAWRRNLWWTSAYSFALHGLACVVLSLKWSMANFGTMRPKLIAKIIVTAIMPSAAVALMSSNVLCEPSASCTRPLAILNRKTPGIIDTTEAHPTAAKGMCHLRETGGGV